MTIETFVLIASVPSMLSVLGLILLSVRLKSRPVYLKLLGLYLLFHAIVFCLSLFFLPTKYRNYSASVSNMLEFLLLSLAYYQITGKSNRLLYVILSLIFIAFATVNMLFFQKNDINSYSLTVMSFIMLFYAIKYFYWLLKRMPDIQLHLHPPFWFNSGSIIYFGGTFFLFVFTEYLWKVLGNDMLTYWTMHNVLMIIYIITMIIAISLTLNVQPELKTCRK